MSEKLLTRKDVAKILNVAPLTVSRWAKADRIPKPIAWPGREPRWRESEVYAKIDEWSSAERMERAS